MVLQIAAPYPTSQPHYLTSAGYGSSHGYYMIRVMWATNYSRVDRISVKGFSKDYQEFWAGLWRVMGGAKKGWEQSCKGY